MSVNARESGIKKRESKRERGGGEGGRDRVNDFFDPMMIYAVSM